MVNLIISNGASEDLQIIIDFISKDSPSYAKIFTKNILKSIQHLKKYPKMGRIVPEANDENIRELLFKNYRIIYFIKEDTIEIYSFLHGNRRLRL